jgi:hypothetical protein
MGELDLLALEGTNPLGFFAALGVLDALAENGETATLRWTDELVPHAVVAGAGDADELIGLLDRDRQRWQASRLLAYPAQAPLADAKPGSNVLRGWFEELAGADVLRQDSDMLCALVAEGAVDGSGGKAKPTHFHFTAGQQRFLEMVRDLVGQVSEDRLREAVFGPWRYDSTLPSLSWDVRGERIYAVRATNPSGDKRQGVPGADWLAFRGLVFYPVRTWHSVLQTTACDPAWKESAFRWPLWRVPATRDVTRSLVADPALVRASGHWPRPETLTARGILSILRAPIKRNAQGGYGSFGGSEVLASAAAAP